jgi:hypothetical protein
MSHSIVRMPIRRRGRDPKKEAFWRETVARHRRGGLGVRAFCACEGLKETAFYFWRREIQRRDRRVQRSTSAFVQLHPVEASTAASDAPLELILPKARHLLIRSGCNMALLRQVLAVLEDQSDRTKEPTC